MWVQQAAGRWMMHLVLVYMYVCLTLFQKYPAIYIFDQDIFTREDGEFLTRHEALPKERIIAVETGGCPHAAIREDM